MALIEHRLRAIGEYQDQGLRQGLRDVAQEMDATLEAMRRVQALPTSELFSGGSKDTVLRSYTRDLEHLRSVNLALTQVMEEHNLHLSRANDSMELAKSGVRGWADAAGAAAAGLGNVAKAGTAAVAALSGAALNAARGESIEKAFHKAVTQMGADSQALLESMREATRGVSSESSQFVGSMMSDLDIMRRSTIAVGSIQKEAIEAAGGAESVMAGLTQAAMASARATGVNLTQAFNDVVVGVARTSPMLLDNIGITMRMGDVYESAAAKLGKSTKEMTIAERQTALLVEVLRQGKEKVDAFGISTGGIKTQMERAKAATENLTYHIGRAMIPAMTPVVEAFAQIATLVDTAMTPAFNALGQVLATIPKPLTAFVTIAASLKATSGVVGELAGFLGPSGGGLVKAFNALSVVAPIAGAAMVLFSKDLGGLIHQFRTWEGLAEQSPGLDSIKSRLTAIRDEIMTSSLMAFDSLGRAAIQASRDILVALGVPLPELNAESLYQSLQRIVSRAQEGAEALTAFVSGLTVDIDLSWADRVRLAIEMVRIQAPEMAAAFERVGPALLKVGEWAAVARDAIVRMAQVVGSAARTVIEHWDTVSTVLKGLAAAVIALKIAVPILAAAKALSEFATAAGLAREALTAGKGISTALSAFELAQPGVAGLTSKTSALSKALLGLGPHGIAAAAAIAAFSAAYATNFLGTRDVTNRVVGDISKGLGELGVAFGNLVKGANEAGLQINQQLPEILSTSAEGYKYMLSEFTTSFGQLREFWVEQLKQIGIDFDAGNENMREDLRIHRETWQRTFDGLGTAWDSFWSTTLLTMRMAHPEAMGALEQLITRALEARQRLGEAFAAGMQGGDMFGYGKEAPPSRLPFTTKAQDRNLHVQAAMKHEMTMDLQREDIQKKFDLSGGGGGGGAGAADLGGLGGGGKDGKGGGATRDPVQDAWQAISTVSNAIMAGIDAMEAVWTRWRGAAPDKLLREVFDSLKRLAEMAVDVAEDLNPEEMLRVQETFSAMGTITGTLSSALDLMEQTVKARFPSEAQVASVIAGTRQIAMASIAMYNEMAGTLDLEDAIEQGSISRLLGEAVGAWIQDMQGVVEVMNGVAAMRPNVDLTPVRAALSQILGIAQAMVGEARAGFGTVGEGEESYLHPRKLLEAKDVAEGLKGWVDIIKGVAEAAKALEGVRMPAGDKMEDVHGTIQGIAHIGRTMVAAFNEGNERNLFHELEEMTLVSDSLSGWVSVIGDLTGVVDAAARLSTHAAQGGSQDLNPVLDVIQSVAHIGRTMTESFQQPHILVEQQDMTLVAQTMKGWVEVVAGVASASQGLRAMQDLARYGGDGSSMVGAAGDLMVAIAGQAGRLWSAASAALGEDLPRATESSAQVASATSAWLEAVSKVANAAMSLRASGAAGPDLMNRVQEIMGPGGLIETVGQLAWNWAGPASKRLTAGAEADASSGIAASVQGWMEALGKVAGTTQALRYLDSRDLDVGDKIRGLAAIVEQIGGLFWPVVAGVLERGGSEMVTGTSQSVAATVGAWIETITSMVGLSRALRELKPVEPGDLEAAYGTLSGIMGFAQRAIQPFADDPIPAEAPEQMTAVAGALREWVGAFADVSSLGFVLSQAIEPTAGEWERAERTATEVYSRILTLTNALVPPARGDGDRFGEWAMEVEPRIKAFADVAKSATEAFAAVSGLSLYGFVEPSGEELGKAQRTIAAISAWLAGLGQAFLAGQSPLDREETIAQIQGFRDVASGAISVIGEVAGLAAGLSMMRVPDIESGLMVRLQETLVAVYQTVDAAFRVLVPETGDTRTRADQMRALAETQAFVETASGVLGLAGDAAGLLSGLAQQIDLHLRKSDVATIGDAIRRFYGLLASIAAEFVVGAAGSRENADSLRQLSQTGEFTSVASTVSETIGGVVETMTLLGERAGLLGVISGSLQAQIKNGIRAMVGMMSQLAQEFGTGTSEGQRLQAEAVRFAEAVGPVVGVVGQVAQVLNQLDEMFWETVENSPKTAKDVTSSAGAYETLRASTTTTHPSKTKVPRAISVTRENIRRVVEMAKVMLAEWITATQSMEEEIRQHMLSIEQAADGVTALDVVAKSERMIQAVTGAIGAIGGTMQVINDLMQSPLTALPYTINSTTGAARGRSNFAIGVANRRITGSGGTMDALKNAIKRHVQVMVQAINEVIAETQNVPTTEALNGIQMIQQTIAGLVATITDVMSVPEIDMSQIQRFVSAVSMLAGAGGIASRAAGAVSMGSSALAGAASGAGGFAQGGSVFGGGGGRSLILGGLGVPSPGEQGGGGAGNPWITGAVSSGSIERGYGSEPLRPIELNPEFTVESGNVEVIVDFGSGGGTYWNPAGRSSRPVVYRQPNPPNPNGVVRGGSRSGGKSWYDQVRNRTRGSGGGNP